MASILAEAYLCKKLGWKIGFLSAGYGSLSSGQMPAALCVEIGSPGTLDDRDYPDEVDGRKEVGRNDEELADFRWGPPPASQK